VDINSNPWTADNWNITEQGKFLRLFGKKLASIKANEAGTTLGGPRPVKIQKGERGPRGRPGGPGPRGRPGRDGLIQVVGLSFMVGFTFGNDVNVFVDDGNDFNDLNLNFNMGADLAQDLRLALPFNADPAIGFHMAATISRFKDVGNIGFTFGNDLAANVEANFLIDAGTFALGFDQNQSTIDQGVGATNNNMGLSMNVVMGQPPAYVNAGTWTQSVTVTSYNPPLPGSRVNGNLLIAYFAANNSKIITISGGWTMLQNDTNVDFIVAYRYVDGTEAAPSFQFVGGGTLTCQGQVLQFSGAAATGAFGTLSTQTGNSATMAHTGITTTKGQSLVLAMSAILNNQVIGGPPSGWNTESGGNGVWSTRTWDKAVVVAGSSGSLSQAVTTGVWRVSLLEIKSP